MNAIMNCSDEYYALVRKFPLIPLKTRKHYRLALQVIDELTDEPLRLTRSQEDYLSVLGHLMAIYEKEHLPASPDVSARDILAFLMRQNDLTLSALAREIGGHKSNLSAFMNGTRSLSKELALALSERFKLDVGLFLRD